MSKTDNQEINVLAESEEDNFSQLLRLLEESEEPAKAKEDEPGELNLELELEGVAPAAPAEQNCEAPDGAPAVVVLEPKPESDADDGEYNVQESLLDDNSYENLSLPEGMLPGALEMVVVPAEEEEARPQTWSDDGDHSDFLNYLFGKMKSIPQHSGQTTVGCEKAISYLRKLDKEISKAIQSDEDNVIDENESEKVRDMIHDYIEKLENAYDKLVNKKRKKKKKASFSIGQKIVARLGSEDVEYYASVIADGKEEKLLKVEVVEPTDQQVLAFVSPDENGLTKEASALVTYVDPFIDSITRLIIRSHITQGKDIREVYGQLDDQYSFTDREKLSIHEILKQKGIGGTGLHVDLGRINEKEPNQFDGKNIEFATEYYA